jgi:azurin
MKTSRILPFFAALALLAGCSKPADTSAAGNANAAAAPAATTGPRTVNIEANDSMKYNVTSIDAQPGEEIKVVLTNVGVMPKEAMGHNWVLLKAGTDVTAFATAAAAAKDTGYIPPSLKDQIIAHIDQLGPKQSGEVTFKAPTEPGTYPFLCSFPGHFVNMKGTLTVK